ncbi:hypothetical protein [Bradyrhizobium sp. sBnM-33]|uniref:hypothetical protein n=1 Tax=Bradyrhizobium sp. sBnM-33 TaxID=2831780 RepID=UPI001BCCED39|nr:hypothetical protein [Bradyrhizobium sp. sBnM-33]WOH53899.1 hypothetical protein RX328_18505 [Bradyrhizobium sp. sBnM-33]
MGHKIQFAKAKALVRSENLSKQFAELQKLKKQVRLAEAAAKRSPPRRARLAV